MRNKPNSLAGTRVRARGPGAIMRNKAKLGQAGISGGQHVGTLLCRTNPIWHHSAPQRSEMASNKANLRMDRKRREPAGPPVPPVGQFCETNPISAGVEWDEAPGARDAGPTARNKPSGAGRPRPQRTECAERSQFTSAARKTIVKAKGLGDSTRHWAAVQTNPISGGRPDPKSELCKTNPISSSLTETRGAKCAKQDAPDKSRLRRSQSAISARERGSKLGSATSVVGVKQSQIWAGWGTWRILHRRGGLCETKPIPRRVGPAGGRLSKTKPICPAQRNQWGKPHPAGRHNCAKQTQFSPAGREAGPFGGKQCKTNPIWPSGQTARAAGGHKHAKQTQFPGGEPKR
jgi:hypothetical protein